MTSKETSPCTYPVSIPSIWDKHNDLPRKHGFVDLDRNIRAGEQVDENELNKAWALVKYLETIAELDADPMITKAVITTARIRAKAIDQAIINAHCGVVETSSAVSVSEDDNHPQPHELDGSDLNPPIVTSPEPSSQKRLQGKGVQAKLKAMTTAATNFNIKWKNTSASFRNVASGSSSQDLDPIQKTVPGDGFALVHTLGPAFSLQRNKIHASLVNAYEEAYVRAEVGSTPPLFRRDPSTWSADYILTLVYFYNMDFGLKRDEPLAVWQRKAKEAFLVSSESS